MNLSDMKLKYYYNQIPGGDQWRNNLIYTSLINENQTVFVQHYVNDSDYHKGMNEVIDPTLMESKWNREVVYLTNMSINYPDLVPKILDINFSERKLYLEIDGPDLWQRSLENNNCSFDDILPDWQEQMLTIVDAHNKLGFYKYSMHPSSYFIVNGKLKSINYFFAHSARENTITIESFLSHISQNRRKELVKYSESLGIDWQTPTDLKVIQRLCWDSFRTNYPADFIEKAIECIK
jgi:hypothetical protein